MCVPSEANSQGFVHYQESDGDASRTRLLLNEEHDNSQEQQMSISNNLFNEIQAVRDEAFQSLQNEDNMKHCVQHNYHDHANDDDAIYLDAPIVTKGGVSIPFPIKLHNMLDHIDLFEPELSNIIRWQPHGRCFLVKNTKEFAANVLPRFFDQKKYASFQRQLNLYGFNRITAGPDKGSYYHELFLRSKKILCRGIHRMKIKGTGTRMASNPKQEPNFYKMVSMPSSSFAPRNNLQPEIIISKEEHTSRSPQIVTSPTPVKEETDASCNHEMPALQLPQRAVPCAEMTSSLSNSFLSQPKVDIFASYDTKRPDVSKDEDSGILPNFDFVPSITATTSHASPLSTDHYQHHQTSSNSTSNDLSFVFGNMPFHSIDTSLPYYFNDRRNSLINTLVASDEGSRTPKSSSLLDDMQKFDTKNKSTNFIDLGLRNDICEQDMSELLSKIVNQDVHQDVCAL